MDGDQPRRLQFTVLQWMAAMGGLALGLWWLPVLPVLAWLGLFLGPHADRRRNLLPMLILAVAFYVPAPMCVMASQQSHWDPHFAWDHVAQEYLWAAPCLPGFPMALPIAAVLGVDEMHPVCQLAMGLTTLAILALFTRLARIHVAILVGLAAVAFCYSLAISIALPAAMRA